MRTNAQSRLLINDTITFANTQLPSTAQKTLKIQLHNETRNVFMLFKRIEKESYSKHFMYTI